MAKSKTYVGYTNNVDRRMREHNVTETSGFTLHYRPWLIIRTEIFQTKLEAMKREKFLKSGKGRNELKLFVSDFLNNNSAVSAAAEKD